MAHGNFAGKVSIVRHSLAGPRSEGNQRGPIVRQASILAHIREGLLDELSAAIREM